ncbi:MAG: Rieske (2Fe-2S) protein [Planctomycetes bacterium]|nr:Rieske (2Fe-2S) protein [Planctomycetota bacterium]
MRPVTTLSALREGPFVAGGLCVWQENGRVYAFDNRCPHLGFPMNKGSLKDGIVTCHWHQWRFDACGGGCLTEGGVDVPSYAVEVRGEDVWVEDRPRPAGADARWDLLDDGLAESNTSKIARAVVALADAGATDAELGRRGARFAATHRESWGPGLTILTAHLNVLAALDLPREDRVLALVHGLRAVARDCEGQAPPVPVHPLPNAGSLEIERLQTWFHDFIEQRDGEAAKRCLLTLVEKGATPRQIADALLWTLTDHVFLDGGHALDFAEKAFELLDRIGWGEAWHVLRSLVSDLANAERSEEDSDWRIPVDLVELLAEREKAMDGKAADPEQLLADDPARVLEALAPSHPGAGDRLARAALLRVARFHLRNEFFDWDTVHHALTYAAAARRFAPRTRGGLPAARAMMHGAMDVYLVRFLNMPAAPLPVSVPHTAAAADLRGELATALACKDVDAAARAAASWLASGLGPRDLWKHLAHLYLIEDHAFHTAQAFEACLVLGQEMEGLESALPAVAVTRYLAAHSPTNRTLEQAVTAAVRLARGDRLYEE